MNKTRYTISAAVIVGASLGMAAVAFAAGDTTHSASHGPFQRPLVGTVAAESGSTLTLSVTASSTAAVTTYTVDDSSAKILKSGTTTTASSIDVGDKLAVIGTVSGTNITARLIIDGIQPHRANGPPANRGGRTGSGTGRSFASSTRPFMRPAAFGSVSATDGSSFTVAERSKTGTTTMTIDIDASTVFKEGTTTASFSSLAVGNLVAVSGTTTATDEILASQVLIMPKLSFGKGFGGHFQSKKTWTKRTAAAGAPAKS